MDIATLEKALAADGLLAKRRERLVMTSGPSGWTVDWPEIRSLRQSLSAHEKLEFRSETQAVTDFLTSALETALSAPIAARLGISGIALNETADRYSGELRTFKIRGPRGPGRPLRLRNALNRLARARAVAETRGLPPDGESLFQTVLVLTDGELVWTGTAADENAALAAAVLSLLADRVVRRRCGPPGLVTLHRLSRDGTDLPPGEADAMHHRLTLLLS